MRRDGSISICIFNIISIHLSVYYPDIILDPITKLNHKMLFKILNMANLSNAVVHHVAGHQAHGVIKAAYGQSTHCSPLVLFRVVHEHILNMSVVAIGATYIPLGSGQKLKLQLCNIVLNSPVIKNLPLPTPRPRRLLIFEGRLATSCHALPPSFLRVSVEANQFFTVPSGFICIPPATI